MDAGLTAFVERQHCLNRRRWMSLGNTLLEELAGIWTTENMSTMIRDRLIRRFNGNLAASGGG